MLAYMVTKELLVLWVLLVPGVLLGLLDPLAKMVDLATWPSRACWCSWFSG